MAIISNNSENIHNYIITVAMIMLSIALLSSFTSTNISAVPPSNGYNSSADCSIKYTSSGSLKTCCYRQSTGQTISPTYCQTCKVDANSNPISCNDPVVQNSSSPQGGDLGTTSTDNRGSVGGGGGILKNPDSSNNKGTSDAQSPLGGGGVLSNQP